MAGLSGMTSADAYAAMAEHLRSGELPTLYQRTNQRITALFSPAENIKPSGRLIRIPMEVYAGGNFSMVNMGGGDIPNGSAGLIDELKLATKEMAYVFRFTDRVAQETETTKQSVVNVAKRTIKNAVRELQEYEDMLWHQNGSGKLTGGAASATTWASGAKTQYTFTESSDFIGVNRLREGMSVLVFNSSNAQVHNNAAGAGAYLQIEELDRANGVVRLSRLLDSSSPAAGDVLVFNGQSVSTTGADFSGTPPNTTDAAPHGMYHFNDSGTSTYVQGKLKSSWPQLVPSYINGTGTTYTSRLATNLQHLLLKRFGDDAIEGLIAIMPLAQADALHVEQQQVSVVNAETIESKANHRLPKELTGPRPKTTIAGIPHYTSYRQARNRVDFLNPKFIIKAERLSLQPIKVEGSTTWQALSTNAGKRAYAKEGGFHMAFDWGNLKPGAGAFIDNLSTASGYKA